MLQVLLREEENIPDPHITGISKRASNGGDLQENQMPGLWNQGSLLRVSPTTPMVSKSTTIPPRQGCALFTHTNNSSTNKWDGLGKVGTGEAPPRSDKPEPLDKSSRRQSTSIPPCPTCICSTNARLQQGRRM